MAPLEDKEYHFLFILKSYHFLHYVFIELFFENLKIKVYLKTSKITSKVRLKYRSARLRQMVPLEDKEYHFLFIIESYHFSSLYFIK